MSDKIVRILLESTSCTKFRAEQLTHKINREQLAWKLIEENKGNHTEKSLNRIFDIADKDTRNRRWFGPLLAVPNRNRIFNNSLEHINKWIDTLLFSGLNPIISINICLKEISVGGASKGLATLFLYLSNPSAYNVWLPSTEKGLVELGTISKFSGKNYGSYYKEFNDAAVEFGCRYNLKPQEIDWALSFIPAYIKDRDKVNRYY